MTALIVVAALFVAAKYGWPAGVAGGVVAWLVDSYFRTWEKCWICKGNVKHESKSKKTWGEWCWGDFFGLGCKAKGNRHRLGAKLLGRGFGRF